MDGSKRLFLAINVLGGLAVLGSYAQGLGSHPELRQAMWGGVPETWKPVYTVSMLLAAVGYFPTFSYFLLGLDAQRARFGERFGFGLVNALYVGVLLPSALWMPLTVVMLQSPSTLTWVAIRVVLALVGLSALGLLVALLRVRQAPRGLWWGLAVVGLLPFCFQTAFLDALVWPAWFPR